MTRVLFAAAEGLPYIKSGGLADVIASLPKSLVQQGHEVAVVLPLYKKILEKFPEIREYKKFHVQSGIINKDAYIYRDKVDGVEYYFIRQDDYFLRDGMYGYPDDGERFAFYCKAVLDMLQYIPFDPQVIHTNDWHTGMIPVLCKKEYTDERYRKYRHVYTIHNLLFQGNFPRDVLRCFNLNDEYYKNGDIRTHNDVNFMKAAIVYADKITTVSPQYAREIQTSEYGEGLQGDLTYRNQNLSGIVNGIDVEQWNPETDPNIYVNYSVNKLAGKKECKKSLQYQLGLRVAEDVLLIGIVTRLTRQKGMNLILDRLGQIMNQDVQLVILGSGDAYIENELKRIESTYPHRAVFYCGYNEELSHRIYAGCDLFLMPSLFEPCGISQLISMRYGTLPLVRETGGLKDTVEPLNEYENKGDGFSFRYFTSEDMMQIIFYAINMYYFKKDVWKKTMKRAMKRDVSWDKSAREYEELYERII